MQSEASMFNFYCQRLCFNYFDLIKVVNFSVEKTTGNLYNAVLIRT